MKLFSYLLLSIFITACAFHADAQQSQQRQQQQRTPQQQAPGNKQQPQTPNSRQGNTPQRQQNPNSQQGNPQQKQQQQATPQQQKPAQGQAAQTKPAQPAQTPVAKTPSPVVVKVNKAALKGKALGLELDIQLPYIDVPSHESLQLTLVLVENTTNKKKQSVSLPPIIIHGANKRKMYERTKALSGEAVANGTAYAVLKTDKDLIQYVQFKKAIVYKTWMSNCQLQLLSERKNYGDKVIDSSANMVQKKITVSK
jgi:hypothetical protein